MYVLGTGKPLVLASKNNEKWVNACKFYLLPQQQDMT